MVWPRITNSLASFSRRLNHRNRGTNDFGRSLRRHQLKWHYPPMPTQISVNSVTPAGAADAATLCRILS
jgi:hypothetical protein